MKKLNWGALAAILAIVLVFAYDSLAPKQATAPRAAKSLSQLQKELDEKKAAAQAALAVVDGQTWQVARDQVGPKAMDWVSRQAQANFVQVSAFRPQRTADADGRIGRSVFPGFRLQRPCQASRRSQRACRIRAGDRNGNHGSDDVLLYPRPRPEPDRAEPLHLTPHSPRHRQSVMGWNCSRPRRWRAPTR